MLGLAKNPSGPNDSTVSIGVAGVKDLATHAPREDEGTSDPIGADVYLSQITGFYQFVISILLGIITVVLALSFMYLRFTSRLQTEEVAREALEAESFRIVLGKLVNDEFVASKNKGDIADIMSALGEFDTALDEVKDKQIQVEKRITFLEKVMTAKSYQTTLEEETDGNT